MASSEPSPSPNAGRSVGGGGDGGDEDGADNDDEGGDAAGPAAQRAGGLVALAGRVRSVRVQLKPWQSAAVAAGCTAFLAQPAVAAQLMALFRCRALDIGEGNTFLLVRSAGTPLFAQPTRCSVLTSSCD